MPLFGTLSTMPLEDLLRWLGSTHRTGTLKVERERVSKCVLLSDGRICGCTSNDPPEKLGHFLLSRGRVTEQQLRSALAAQEGRRQYLGAAFVSMGVLTDEELASHLEAQAEETIYGLFDWDEAVFRFNEQLGDQTAALRLDLDVAEVVVRGLKRAAEVRQIREVFPDSNVVLRKSSLRLPSAALSNTMARTLYEAISGERTLAELLLHVHGSEYLVTRFLYALHSGGFIETQSAAATPRPVLAGGTAVDDGVESAFGPGVTGAAGAPQEPTFGHVTAGASSLAAEIASMTAAAVAEAPPPSAEMDLPDLSIDPHDLDPGAAQGPELLDIPDLFVESSDVEAIEDSPGFHLQKNLALARRQMNNGQFEQALTVFAQLLRKHPDDDSLRRLLAETEAAFIDRAYRHYTPATKIPTLTRSMESLIAEQLSPSEFFLISRIDGTWDVKSIVQIAPLREVDVLITLKRLRENGMIEFKDIDVP